MKLTLFTVEEANHVVTTIRPQVERLVSDKREMSALDRRIEALSGVGDDEATQRQREKLQQQLESLRSSVSPPCHRGRRRSSRATPSGPTR